FNPNGHTLATTGYDDRVRLWDTSPDQAARNICPLISTVITPAQWQQYITDLPYNPPCTEGVGDRDLH
ncbi:MAG: hypothetical protein ACRDP1_11825, partial [Nocardioidaceae bacterium]